MISIKIGKKCSFKDDKMRGGLADFRSDDEFDPEALKKGIETEMRHHTNDPEIAKEIVKDNLVEDPNYYDDE